MRRIYWSPSHQRLYGINVDPMNTTSQSNRKQRVKSYYWWWVNRCKVITSFEETPLSPAHTRHNLHLRRDTSPESATVLVWNVACSAAWNHNKVSELFLNFDILKSAKWGKCSGNLFKAGKFHWSDSQFSAHCNKKNQNMTDISSLL